MRYKVKATTLKYKGKIYKPGSTIDLDKKEAEHFINFNFIEVIKNQSLDKIEIIKKREETDKTKRKKELEKLNTLELKEIASDMDIELTVTKKAEIIEAIMEAEDEL